MPLIETVIKNITIKSTLIRIIHFRFLKKFKLTKEFGQKALFFVSVFPLLTIKLKF